ncbi:MAG: transcriptional repressor LexA [gamma proteobacterium endosymbiont of Lamellibrachia anaximandri]|nr:transcriptional repressor LexA [gamma proteobacterium endosymbiont of Lamellibrachia anaximandri]MBL3619470.1 transcriptional repressor LexA [gamma proteobacterium endosymbiont of Lamellibrachia anaximandri]
MKLTPRQTEVLELVRSHLEVTGFPPTRAEIAEALGFRSVNAAEEHLRALAKKGAIELLKGRSRGIRLLLPEEQDAGMPVVGRVAAGSPILAEEHIEERYPFSPALFHPPADYLLRVSGTSMRDVGIMDGDLLAVHRTSEAHNGQIVVARLDDEVTVKRFHRDARHRHLVVLLPENADFEPIRIDLREQHLVIEGLGVGVLRQGLEISNRFSRN